MKLNKEIINRINNVKKEASKFNNVSIDNIFALAIKGEISVSSSTQFISNASKEVQKKLNNTPVNESDKLYDLYQEEANIKQTKEALSVIKTDGNSFIKGNYNQELGDVLHGTENYQSQEQLIERQEDYSISHFENNKTGDINQKDKGMSM